MKGPGLVCLPILEKKYFLPTDEKIQPFQTTDIYVSNSRFYPINYT
jgi:hypothetical protein